MTDEELNALEDLADFINPHPKTRGGVMLDASKLREASTAIKSLIERLRKADAEDLWDKEMGQSFLDDLSRMRKERDAAENVVRDINDLLRGNDLFTSTTVHSVVDLIDAKDRAESERDEAYRALVCLVDCDIYNPKWDDHCRVQEKARKFVEDGK